MSYTEIVKFTKSGKAKKNGETRNSHRGATTVWRTLEDKYLPPYIPSWVTPFHDSKETYHRSIIDLNAMKEIWNLFYDSNVSREHKIVLASTFDKVIVFKKDLLELIEAYKNYEWESSLSEQALILENLLKTDKNFIAVAWNQTSVNQNHWLHGDDNKVYNILKDTDHWDLFDDLNNM